MCRHPLGNRYYEKDNGKAIEWYEKAYIQGYKDSSGTARILGMIYYFGEHGVSRNLSKAFEWLKKAADLGDALAMKCIGDMYIEGEFVQADYFKGIEYLEKGLNLEPALNFQDTLRKYLRMDRTRFNEFDRIFAQEEKSAMNGNHWAMNRLGDLFSLGVSYLEEDCSIHWGVKKDLDKAFEWYEKSANLGNLKASYKLAQIFSSYSDNEWFKYRDLKKAVKWLEKYLNIFPKKNNSLEYGYGNKALEYLCNVLMTGSDTLPKDVDKVVEWCGKYYDDYLFVKYDWQKFLLQ